MKKRKHRHNGWWAAAAVLVLVGAGMFYLRSKITEPHTARVAKADSVQAGRNTATLTLANGSTIYLEETADGRVAVENGVEIIKAEDGITYKLPEHLPPASGAASLINTVTTPRGGYYRLKLPDGSTAWMNAASSIQFPAMFDQHNRTVSVTGEVYFEIAHDKKRPFRVHASGETIEVLGTKFNVNVYSDEPEKKITLLEGSVRISNNHGIVRNLRPGEQAVMTADQIQVFKTETDIAVAWINGDFTFDGTPLKSIMRQISRWYDVEVVYEGNVANLHFGGTISRTKSINDVLKLLEMTRGVRFRLEGRKVFVMP